MGEILQEIFRTSYDKYILEEPALFSTEPIAEFFINDVTKIMSHANSMTDAAKEWLRKTAEVNKVDFSFKELIGKISLT